jgi:hypothetical protein
MNQNTTEELSEVVPSVCSMPRLYNDNQEGKTLTISVMTYAHPAWELAADTYLLKL